MPTEETSSPIRLAEPVGIPTKAEMAPGAQQSFFPQWFHDGNAVVSLFGFLITLWVWWNVSSIRSSFMARARLPEIIRDLNKASSTMNQLMNQWPTQRNEAIGQLKTAAALIKTGQAYADRSDRKELKRICKKLEGAAESSSIAHTLGFEAAWDMYSDIQKSSIILGHSNKDLKWRS